MKGDNDPLHLCEVLGAEIGTRRTMGREPERVRPLVHPSARALCRTAIKERGGCLWRAKPAAQDSAPTFGK